MKAVYLFCAVLVLALSSSTPAHADISTSATPTTDTGYGESPATDTPVGTECREYIPADTAAAPALSAAHDAPRPRGFWFYFKTTLFCLRDHIAECRCIRCYNDDHIHFLLNKIRNLLFLRRHISAGILHIDGSSEFLRP